MLEGDGFSYVIMPDYGDPYDGEAFVIDDRLVNYYGPGAYLWVEESSSATFSVPAQVDGQPVVSVKTIVPIPGVETIDLSAVGPTLRYLSWPDNNLTSIDLSACGDLRFLDVMNNPITSLDVTACPELESLWCASTQIAELDLTRCPKLYSIGCGDTLIERLDLTQNTELLGIECSNARLVEILLPEQSKVVLLLINHNFLDEESVAAIEAWGQAQADPPYIQIGFQRDPQPQEPTEPEQPEDPDDPENPDNPDDQDDPDDSKLVTPQEGDGYYYGILTGEESFADKGSFYLGERFTVNYGPGAYIWAPDAGASLTVPATIDGWPVVSVEIDPCGLESLDVSAAGSTLARLTCFDNNLTSIDLSGCSALVDMDIDNNPLTALDVSDSPLLESLQCRYTQISELDVSNNPTLYGLYCDGTLLRRLDLSSNGALMALSCTDCLLEEIVMPMSAPDFVILFAENNYLDAEAVEAIRAWGEALESTPYMTLEPQRVAEPDDPEEPTGPEQPGDPQGPDSPGDSGQGTTTGQGTTGTGTSGGQQGSQAQKPGGIPQTGDETRGQSGMAVAAALGGAAALAAGTLALRRRDDARATGNERA